MATTTMVHVRVDENIKAQATETLAAMGLSVSDAVRVFLMRVVAEQQMPFAIKAPNAATRAAMAEADTITRTRRARFGKATELFNDLEKKAPQVSALYCHVLRTIPRPSKRIGNACRAPVGTICTGSRKR